MPVETLSTSKGLMVMCSAGNGEMAGGACLTCALESENMHPPCGYDHALLRVMFEEQDRSGIHVSDLTGCVRMAYLKKTDPAPEYVHEKLTRTLGTLTHGLLEKSDEHADAEVALEALGIVGRADRVYKDGRVLDLKTTRWRYLDRLPYASHALQVNIYAHLLREMGRPVTSLAIQYIDLSGPTKCRRCRVTVRMHDGVISCPSCGGVPKNAHLGAALVEIPLLSPREAERLIVERREQLQAALESGITPAPEPSYLCGYCSYQGGCPEASGGIEE